MDKNQWSPVVLEYMAMDAILFQRCVAGEISMEDYIALTSETLNTFEAKMTSEDLLAVMHVIWEKQQIIANRLVELGYPHPHPGNDPGHPN